MEWFKGSIPEAITKAKSQGTLFVVAIHGWLALVFCVVSS